MPQIIPAVAAVASSIATAVGGAAIVATGSTALGLAIAGGVYSVVTALPALIISTAIGRVLRGKVPVAERQADILKLSLGEGPREVIFGQAATGGRLIDAYNWDTDNVRETLVICLASHECESLVGFYVNDRWVPFVASGPVAGFAASDGFSRLEVIWFPSGGVSQRQYQAKPDRWSTSDIMGGCAFVVVTYHKVDEVFPQGRPSFRWVVRGAKLYDPRKDSTVAGGSGTHRWGEPQTYVWSQNAEVCAFNYQRGIYSNGQLIAGPGRSADEAPATAGVLAAMNKCDELVTNKDGSTEARYRAGGVVKANEIWADVLDDFADAMGGNIVDRSGAVFLDPGAGKSPVKAFTDTDILRGTETSYRAQANRDQIVNSVAVSFIDPTQMYEVNSAPLRRSQVDINTDGEVRELSLQLRFVWVERQAQRLGEMLRRRARYEAVSTVSLGAEFCQIETGDWVEWTSARYTAGVPRVFEVQAYQLDENLNITLQLREIATAAFAWDAATDELTPQRPAYLPAGAPEPAEIVGFTANMVEIPGADGSRPVAIQTSWTRPGDATIVAVRIEYRAAGSEVVLSDTEPTPAAAARLVINGVTDYVNYEVRAVPITQPAREVLATAWRDVPSLRLKPNPPPDVASFDVYPGDDFLRFVWIPVSTSVPVDYEIRYGQSWQDGTAVARVASDTTTVKQPTLQSGDQVYWIKAVTRLGDVYSVNARFTSTRQAPVATRNVIFEEDFAEDNWPGVRHDLTLVGAGLDSYLELDFFEGARRPYGDYFAKVELTGNFYARAWGEFGFGRAASSGTTIDDLSGTPISALSGISILPAITATDEALLRVYIAERRPVDGFIDGCDFDNDLLTLEGETPVEAVNLTYAEARIADGVRIAADSGLAYSLPLPDEFSMAVEVRPFAAVTDDGCLLRLSAGAAWLELRYEHDDSLLALIGSDGERVEIAAPAWALDDIAIIAIAQSDTTRALFCQTRRAPAVVSASGEHAPIGDWTRIRFGGARVSAADFSDWLAEDFEDYTAEEIGDLAAPFPAIYSNWEARATPLDAGGFIDYGRRAPSGYQPFRQFVPGDYEFIEAMIWMRISTEPVIGDVLAINKGRVFVDVPDVIDSGLAEVEIGGTVIAFNRNFYTAPKVTAVQRGGVAAAIISVDLETPDTARLKARDPNTNAETTADAAWTAVGY